MKFFLLALFLMLTACGFTPVYGDKSLSLSIASIDIQTIPNRDGQIVRNHLIDQLYKDGYPSKPDYKLTISPIQESTVEIGIDRDDEVSRAQLRQETSMILTNIKTNKPVLKRTIRATSGYNILTGQFTTYVTEEDARNQALKALSDNIITQLELYFNQ